MSEGARTVVVAFVGLAAGFTWQAVRATLIPPSSPDGLVRDPRQALTMLALTLAAHALVDVAHRPGLLPDGVAPRWYLVGCAVYDVYIGALCYLPILGR